MGRNWRVISDLHFPNRATLSLKNRHALLLRRQARPGLSQGGASSVSVSDKPDTSECFAVNQEANDACDNSMELELEPNNNTDYPLQNGVDASGSEGFRLPSFEQTPVVHEYMAVPETGILQQQTDKQSPDPAQSTSIDMLTYNNMLTEGMAMTIDPFFTGEFPLLPQHQQQHHQHQLQEEQYQSPNPFISQLSEESINQLQAPTMTPPSSSTKVEIQEEVLCIGILCPHMELENFKIALLQTTTKVRIKHDDSNERIQVKMTILRIQEEVLCIGILCPRMEIDNFKVALLEASTKVRSKHDGSDERVQVKMTLLRKD